LAKKEILLNFSLMWTNIIRILLDFGSSKIDEMQKMDKPVEVVSSKHDCFA
jgi:hypothetical protein